jgi:hypothetical protein
MKTAVEWLIDELYKQGISLYTPELIAEAKEMHKEQMKKFYGKLQVDENNLVIDFENYYNQTFKQQEQ